MLEVESEIFSVNGLWGGKMTEIQCDTCAYMIYDEEYEDYFCDVNMDEDDAARLYSDHHFQCPYYRNGDEYTVVRKQM